ncbi:MAG: hypothetical protein HQL22_05870 [Candidatus Omnitrophica bacterium]|nr:hypothetical protein [Candidatus Omnitrophota bacterium]
MEKNDRAELNIPAGCVWLLLAFVPVIVILVSFILGGWSWGLMDDYSWVKMPGTVWERMSGSIGNPFLAGRFLPVHVLHSAFFYKIFAENPTAFYIFRWVECVVALGLWAFLSFRVTRSQFAAPLFIFVTLSFYKVYDAFFFLSTQEILGILFFGAAALFFLNAVESRFTDGGKIRWNSFSAGVVLLMLTFGSKEPFLVAGAALGISSIVVSLADRKKGILSLGIIGLMLAVAYAVFLKLFVMKGYSATYAATDPGVIGENLMLWAQKDLPFHVPWILLAALLMVCFFRTAFQKWTAVRTWAFLTGVTAYLGYLLVILPWSAWGHYVTPLGVFFGFAIAVLLADRIERLALSHTAGLFLLMFAFSMIVGAMALKFYATYQYDSANLMKWLATNSLFEHEVSLGAVVRGNAWEPCETIVNQVNGIYGKNYEKFVLTSSVREILADVKTRYYLWGRHWGDQDLSRLGAMWTPVFISDHWVLFRRMF